MKHYIGFLSAHSTREDGPTGDAYHERTYQVRKTAIGNKEAHDAENNVNVLPVEGRLIIMAEYKNLAKKEKLKFRSPIRREQRASRKNKLPIQRI